MKEYKMYLLAQVIAIIVIIANTIMIMYIENIEISEDEPNYNKIVKTLDNSLENAITIRFLILIIFIGSNLLIGISLGIVYLIKRFGKNHAGVI